MSIEKVNELRNEMKEITNEILTMIGHRMELARKIGEIKTSLDLAIVDDKAELSIKSHVLDNSRNFNLDPEFTGRIVNLLITEAVRIQNIERMRKLNEVFSYDLSNSKKKSPNGKNPWTNPGTLKPPPNSTPLTAGILNNPFDISDSSDSKIGSPKPTGAP